MFVKYICDADASCELIFEYLKLWISVARPQLKAGVHIKPKNPLWIYLGDQSYIILF